MNGNLFEAIDNLEILTEHFASISQNINSLDVQPGDKCKITGPVHIEGTSFCEDITQDIDIPEDVDDALKYIRRNFKGFMICHIDWERRKPRKKEIPKAVANYDTSKYNTEQEIKDRIKEINRQLAYIRRRDKVCCAIGSEQEQYDLNIERDALRNKLKNM